MTPDGDPLMVGRQYALARRPIKDCPYDVNGPPAEQANVMRFVQGYLDAAPATDVDYGSDDATP